MAKNLQTKPCNSFCCNTSRLSVSSSEESETSSSSDRPQTISTIAHAMVQQRLDQMIRDAKKKETTIRRSRHNRDVATKFVVMLAMEKSSSDPREDFRESMVEMIVSNKIHKAKDLRRLLNCYTTMNSDEFKGIILEVFHDVCSDLFVY